MKHRALAIVLAAACASAAAQTVPCSVSQVGVKMKDPAGVVFDWWPKTTSQPTGGTVEVIGGSLALPVVVVVPAPAQIKAGIAPDARGFCIPLAKLSRGDELAVVMTIEGSPKQVARCRFETGDISNFRWYGTPKVKLATIQPRVVMTGTAAGLCVGEAALAPPVVSEPETPPVQPPANASWSDIATEHQSFSFVGRARFGLPGHWVEKEVAGYTMCNGAAEWFGADPAPGAVKVCQALQ